MELRCHLVVCGNQTFIWSNSTVNWCSLLFLFVLACSLQMEDKIVWFFIHVVTLQISIWIWEVFKVHTRYQCYISQSMLFIWCLLILHVYFMSLPLYLSKMWCFQNLLNKCVWRQKNGEIEFPLFYWTLNNRIKTFYFTHPGERHKTITVSGILLAESWA